MEELQKENDYLMELMSRINEECNNVIYKSGDARTAINTIKYMLCGSMG